MIKLKAIYILGPDHTSSTALEKLKQVYKQPGYLLIGDGLRDVDLEEISSLKGMIDSNTRVDINAHGNVLDGQHILVLKSGERLYTHKLFSSLNEQNLGKPLYVHLWSCYGGAAAEDIDCLAKGSMLIAHGSSTEATLIASAHSSNLRLISSPTALDNSISYFQKAINELTLFSDAPYTIVTIINNKKCEFVVSYDLEEALMRSEESSIDTQMSFYQFYQDLYPDSEMVIRLHVPTSIELDYFKHGLFAYKSHSNNIQDIDQILSLINDKSKKYLYKNLLNSNLDDSITPLYGAVSSNNIAVVKALLEVGADANIGALDSGTSLYIAAQEGYLKVVKLLLEAEANPNTKDDQGVTPLIIASQNGHVNIVELLLESGADPNISNNKGTTPLYISAQNGHAEIVKLLLEKGGDPNIANNQEVTPLHISAQNGHVEIVELLLEKGVDPNILDNKGVTPLFISAQNGHVEIVELLLNSNADPNIVDYDGRTPLLTAAIKGLTIIVKLLLKHGADVYSTYNGFTILDYVRSSDSNEIKSIFNSEIKERKAMAAKLETLSNRQANDYLQTHSEEVYSFKKCLDDSKPIYKFMDEHSSTFICEYLDLPEQTHWEL